MASIAAALPCQKPPLRFHPDKTDFSRVAFRGRQLVKQRDNKLPTGFVFRTGNERTHLINNVRKPNLVIALAAATDSSSEESSMSDTIKKFYKCINQKNLKQLTDLVSKNCVLEDSFFTYQFRGKKEVVSFFSQLMDSMGQNTQFKTRHFCEGDYLIASVEWHMEWDEDQIPFSRGCSIFQFSKEDGKLVMRKVQIITEPPIKPGKLVMAMLKILTSLFDDFPKAAKWFLKSPQHILKAALTIYSLFLASFVNPVLAFYITLWKFTARLYGYLISIMHLIGKFFGQESPKDDEILNQKSSKNDSDSKLPKYDQSLDQQASKDESDSELPKDDQSLDQNSSKHDLDSELTKDDQSSDQSLSKHDSDSDDLDLKKE